VCFFQAEDGIRDDLVTGVQTCALPISVAQSSADQRKGRSGRVAAGVCIRLYSEKDYLERPRFTQPEIQRANLADVILRMKAFGRSEERRVGQEGSGEVGVYDRR